MENNRISATLSDADRDAVLSAIDAIYKQLPFLIDLTPTERHDLPKMGDKSVAFVERAEALTRQTDSFLPRGFDAEEFHRDAALIAALAPIRTALIRLTELVDDTTTQVGSEAYVAALVVYLNAKANGEGAGFDGLLDELGKRFARKSPPLSKP